MMSRQGSALLAAVAAGLAIMTLAPEADAQPRCRGRVDGVGTGLGTFGMGTANAKSAAVSNWAEKVNGRWGIYYANFDNARGVRLTCKKGAILQAKCWVSAVPCLH